MKKLCAICKHDVDTKLFNKAARRKDGLQSHCRSCNKKRSTAYYQRNKKSHIKRCVARKREVRAELAKRVREYLLVHPCVDCGETDTVVLEFDHVRGKKLMDVCRMVQNGVSWKRVEREIAKCEVRCANDHKRVTARRRVRLPPAGL